MWKNTKKPLALAAALCLALTLLPTAALAADSGFTVENGVLTKYSGPGGAVAIPDGITSIGNDAFSGCTGLTSVAIPDGVTRIGAFAFAGCTGLAGVAFPDSITSIGQNAFESCAGLTSVSIPDGVTRIEDFTFWSCTGLASVTIPDSVTSIGAEAFRYCTGLTSVTIGAGVSSIGGTAFLGTPWFERMGELPVINGILLPYQGESGEVTIPSNVTVIASGAFEYSAGLTSVTIPDGVTRIEDFAFDRCSSLTGVTIPGSVTSIGAYAFQLCESLKDIYYGGTEEQWKAIQISAYGDFRDDLTGVTIHYNSSIPAPDITFSDVPTGAWYAGPVKWAVRKEITNGNGTDAAGKPSFSPGADCTNAQILTFLYRAAGSPAVTSTLPFTPKHDWAADALTWACEKEMIGPDLDEDQPCTRSSAVKYIWQAMGQPAAAYDGRFSDVAATADCATAVAWAVNAGVTDGNGTDAAGKPIFSPNTTCTRGHIVTFLYRAYNKSLSRN